MLLRAAACLAVVALSIPAQAGVEIERVSFTPRSDGAGYVVRLHASGHVPAYSVDQAGQEVELTVYQARLASDVRQDRAAGPVRTYRLEPGEDRVVIRFRVDREVEARAYADRDSDDLLISLDARASTRPVAWGATRTPSRPPAASVSRPPAAAETRTSSSARVRTQADRGVPTRGTSSPDVAPERTTSAPPVSSDPTLDTPTWPGPIQRDPIQPDLTPTEPRREPLVTANRPPESVARPESGVRRWPTQRQESTAERIRPIQPRPADAQPEPVAAATVPNVTPTFGVNAERAEPAASGRPASVVTGAEHWRLDTIVLDAGHGGHDLGGRGHGTSDKEIGFEVVRRLGAKIERELGIRVVYTRDTDTFVELRERGRIANQAGGKLFISVHANAGSPAAYGTETFFLAPRGSNSAREVMARENSVIELESDPSYYAEMQDGGDILRSMAMSAYQQESQLLAQLIEKEFKASGRHSRGVKQDNFMVLWAASMPAVLVEVGFVTNADEARLLKTDAGLQSTAESIFHAVRAYQEQYERGLRLAAQN